MKQYIVDAFTDKLFSGNPAAVCIMENWLPQDLMMKIAEENNLSETAFVVKEGNEYRLRWFTPGGEVDLCGHATLAAAYVINRFFEPKANTFNFITMCGQITVTKNDGLFEMDLPSYSMKRIDVTDEMAIAIGAMPLEAYIGRDLLCIFENEDDIRNMKPDITKVHELDGLLLLVTARGREYDCVSRSFAPKCNIDEDPVCGSGHCHIIPYWAKKLGKNKLTAYQASKRGGTLFCEYLGERVKISGNAVLFSIANLNI